MTPVESPSLSAMIPIAAPDVETGLRWHDQRLRREQLDGTWRDQLVSRAAQVVGTNRITGWGSPSLARALAESVCRELAVLYDEEWRWTHDNPGSGEYLTTTARFAGLQAIQQRMQVYAVGIGSCYLRARGIPPRVPGGLPTVRYEAVPCDLVYDEPRDDGSDQPALVRHYSIRIVDGRPTWTADEWSIHGDGSYRHYIVGGSGLVEAKELTRTGPAYPYRRADGRPVLPYVLYHDGPPRVGLHDPSHREALFAGSLDVAVLYWMATHCYRDASWPQRCVAGLRPIGGESSTDSDGNTVIRHTLDPSTLGMFEDLPDAKQPMQWQWQPGADAEMMFRVLDDLAARIAVEAGGVTPTDLHRAAPNRSGAAISLTNEGKRKMQARATPSFRPGDERLAAVTATIIRSLGGPASLAEDGYRIIYGSTPLSIDEQDARRRHAIEAMDAGLMTRLEAYRYIHPEMSEPDAVAALASMRPPTPAPSPSPTARGPQRDDADDPDDTETDR